MLKQSKHLLKRDYFGKLERWSRIRTKDLGNLCILLDILKKVRGVILREI